jgi:hypothetical protein
MMDVAQPHRHARIENGGGGLWVCALQRTGCGGMLSRVKVALLNDFALLGVGRATRHTQAGLSTI